jgi:tRNA nucleotidyltransferase (CCA-adding enzyme)
LVALVCFTARYWKSTHKRFNKNKDGLFTVMNFLAGKWQNLRKIAYAVKPKMKFVQKIMMSSRPIVLSQDMVTDSAVRRLVLMLVKMLKI